MRFVIISGMSGAGKSTALHTLEDLGFFCVDNLPVELLSNFGQIASDRKLKVSDVAVVVDIRNGEHLLDLTNQMEALGVLGIRYEILFLDASDEELVKRYKETRRTHPLAKGGRIETGICEERKRVTFIREQADYVIDTTSLLSRELKEELNKIFVKEEHYNSFIVTVLSFGFKYGIPSDSDLLFDVRFLPNPYYDLELRPLTGNDPEIQRYVMGHEDSRAFLKKLVDMVEFLIPRYRKEGKYNLVVSIGCTGGRHRSVTIANALYQALQEMPCSVRVDHRDIDRDLKLKKQQYSRKD
ncbi:MAG: RNase adapter RapZ [Lachnospiraceae bacterium]|nr:RNase adapter RapZ [Lachnospiraceae bacterium]